MSVTMRDLIAHLLLLLYVATCGVGCADSKRGHVTYIPPGAEHDDATISMVTTRGVHLRYVWWLDLPINGPSKARALWEIDNVPLSVPAPDGSTKGVPVGAEVVIRNPGAWPSTRSPTGLVSGLCFIAENRIEVAWAGVSGAATKLPTLPHETQHLVTRDPNAGH